MKIALFYYSATGNTGLIYEHIGSEIPEMESVDISAQYPKAAESCNQMSGAASIDREGSFQLRWTDIFVKKQRPGC